MKLFLLFLAAFAACAVANGQHNVCSAQVDQICRTSINGDIPKCNAKFGKYFHPYDKIKNYATEHIDISYKLLMMSAFYGTYEKNREGFMKYYRQLSDKAWEDAIELIKYNNKRGHHMRELNLRNKVLFPQNTYELSEIDAMAKTLDLQKAMAEESHNIINNIEIKHKSSHAVDPETVSFIEGHFLHQHAKLIREMAGHVQDLQQLMSQDLTKSLALSLFDDYLLTTL